MVNALNMLTCLGGFLGFPRPSLSDSKGTKGTNKVACTGATCIESTYTRDICAKDTSVEDTFSAKSACIKGVFIGGTCVKSTCVRGISAVKYLGIDWRLE